MWKTDILQQLKKRNATEWDPFKDILSDYQEIFGMYIKQQEYIRKLEKDTADHVQHIQNLEKNPRSSYLDE
jgi:hypothetical protein